ncbi:MAG: DUF167 domain-containing protein [Dehalococcoidia bacterium]
MANTGPIDGMTRLSVRIVPRASRDVVVGMRSGALLVRVTAPPVDGAANEALIRVLARRLHLAKGALRIVSGRTSKLKVVEVEGIDEAEAMRRLDAPSPLGSHGREDEAGE